MHQNSCRLGLRPRPHWGDYSAPKTPSLSLSGSTSKAPSKGRGEEEIGEEGRDRAPK